MTLIQTIDNLKKKVPHAQIRGPTLFFIVDEERGIQIRLKVDFHCPPSETPFKLPAKRNFNGVLLVDQ